MSLPISPVVTLLDLGVGNLHSLEKALVAVGARVAVETDLARAAREAEALVFPGVGAFGAAAERLAPAREALAARIQGGTPTLGICLGMQLFFDASDEGPGQGLGVIPGRVTRLAARELPHMGWSTLEGREGFAAESGLELAYYAHSFACRPANLSAVVAWSEHEGDRFPAAVRVGRTVGAQFHPEKSSKPGLSFLAAWLRLAQSTASATQGDVLP